jgi:hypothetical protein
LAAFATVSAMHRLLIAGLVAAAALTTAPAGAAPRRPAARLAGTWHTILSDGTNQHIAFHGRRFDVWVAKPDVASMKVAYRGHRVTFSDSTTCPGSGTYRWTLSHGRLRFTLLGTDPCHRAQLLPGKAWTR